MTSVIISWNHTLSAGFEHGYQQQYHCADTVCSSYSVDDLIILWGQKFLEVDYLGIDLLPEDDKHAKKLEEYKAYNPAKELRTSILMAVIPALASAFLLYTDRQWAAVAAMGAALICFESAPYRSQAYEEKSDSGCKECISQVLMDLAY